MAYQKDLGRVKGDQGNVFIPNMEIVNGKMVFSWTEQSAELHTAPPNKEITLPVYYPTINDQNQLVFVCNSEDINPPANANLTFNVIGPKGDDGEMKLRTQTVTDLETLLSNPSSIREDTLYITSDNYVYFINIEEINGENTYTPVKLEGISLDNYYTKQEVYNKTEIDDMFYESATYMALMFQLLDVSEPDYVEDENIDDNYDNTEDEP